MSGREHYKPGPARGAEVHRDGDQWTLVLIREMRHPPGQVWQALTDPAQLKEWAPFDADRNLSAVGSVRLSTVGAPTSVVSESRVIRADAPTLLEYQWGDNEMRWQLEPLGGGTRLTLWHKIGPRFISMGAAGWHICLDVMDRWIGGQPIGRIVGADAMKFEWPRLNVEYAAQFGVEAPSWPPKATQD